MQFFLLCAVVLATFLATSAVADDVIVLTEQNFESQTQASTGATTGAWLVEFYAPWCGHCKKLEPVFKEVAESLKGKVNVAKVDVTQNRALGQRFDIKGFPTIKFFKDGKIYAYKSARTTEAFVEFATTGYVKSGSELVPGIPTAQDEIIRQVMSIGKDFKKLLATKTNVLIATLSAGVFIGWIFGYLCACCCCGRSKAAPKAKAE